MRAAVYCRLSKAPKVGDNSTNPRSSLDRQEQDGRRIAAERDWDVVAVFREIVPASDPYKARKEWAQLLELIEAKEVDAVILWMEDRANRHVVTAAELVKVCKEAGASKIVLPSYEYDLSDPEDEAKFYGEAVRAQQEIARMKKRIRRMQLELAENGQEHGGGKRPFGFTGSGNRKVPLARALAEQEMIREATTRILAGDSLRGICIDWNSPSRRIPGTTGQPWTTRTLKRVLTSPRTAGLREHNGKLYPAAWSPIVPREQWEAVKAILEDPARRTNDRGGVHRYLLTGMIFCGVCGHRLVGTRKGDYYGYQCPKTERGGGGKCVQRSAAPVEELITEALFLAVAAPQWDRLAERPANDPTRELLEQLAHDQGLLDRLEDKIAQELISPEAALRNRAEIERRMDAAREKLARLGDSRVTARVPRNLRDVWPDLSLDRRRAILKAVLKLPPEGKGIEVHPTGPGRRAFDPDAIRVTWRA
jgi:DNA invertase Pin-like site-specific DNA recombinase